MELFSTGVLANIIRIGTIVLLFIGLILSTIIYQRIKKVEMLYFNIALTTTALTAGFSAIKFWINYWELELISYVMFMIACVMGIFIYRKIKDNELTENGIPMGDKIGS